MSPLESTGIKMTGGYYPLMPKTRAQKIVFSLLMALCMVYGMETYNHIIAGNRTASAFALPVLELLWLMAAVIVLQETIGGRLARRIAFRFVDPQASGKKLRVIVAVQIATVCIICPLMSLLVTFTFNSDVPLPVPVKWGLTFAANFPFALAWQLLVAGPAVRKVIGFIKA
jgi:hypothetical protein